MSDFFRFPHTPHLAWLGEGEPRSDKTLTAAEASHLLESEIRVEEKLDGANLGFSVSERGDLRVQNRGMHLDREHSHAQFRPLWPWLTPHRDALIDALWPHLMLFGEWCLAIHSVEYDALPDWFLGFDVYDRETQRFWSCERRDALLEGLQICGVPKLGSGHFSLVDLKSMLGTSRVGHGPMEGLVVRCEAEAYTHTRAKLVRGSFTQSIQTHWSRGPLRRNRRRGPSPQT